MYISLISEGDEEEYGHILLSAGWSYLTAYIASTTVADSTKNNC